MVDPSNLNLFNNSFLGMVPFINNPHNSCYPIMGNMPLFSNNNLIDYSNINNNNQYNYRGSMVMQIQLFNGNVTETNNTSETTHSFKSIFEGNKDLKSESKGDEPLKYTDITE